MKRFSDFAKDDIFLTGDKLKIEDVVDKEIVVKNFIITDSKYNNKKVLKLQFELENKICVIYTGSTVLLDQAEKYKEEIPFITTIKHINKFYVFT